MSLQPVSMQMSNLNVGNTVQHSPNAYSAVQDTGQRQEIVQEGIRVVQTVQASEAAAEAQRVHRKDADTEQEGRGRRNAQDSFEHTEGKHEEEAGAENAPLIQQKKVRSRRSFEFLA